MESNKAAGGPTGSKSQRQTASAFKLSVLKNRSDFLKIQKGGLKIRSGDWLLLAYRQNDFGHIRCGWTLPRKVGSAVIRNKLKRWTRAFFRSQLAEGTEPLSLDLNVVFLKTTDDFYKKLDYERFSKQMDKAIATLRKRR